MPELPDVVVYLEALADSIVWGLLHIGATPPAGTAG